MLQCTGSSVNTDIPRCVGEYTQWKTVIEMYCSFMLRLQEPFNDTRGYLVGYLQMVL